MLKLYTMEQDTFQSLDSFKGSTHANKSHHKWLQGLRKPPKNWVALVNGSVRFQASQRPAARSQRVQGWLVEENDHRQNPQSKLHRVTLGFPVELETKVNSWQAAQLKAWTRKDWCVGLSTLFRSGLYLDSEPSHPLVWCWRPALPAMCIQGKMYACVHMYIFSSVCPWIICSGKKIIRLPLALITEGCNIAEVVSVLWLD